MATVQKADASCQCYSSVTQAIEQRDNHGVHDTNQPRDDTRMLAVRQRWGAASYRVAAATTR